MHLSSPEQSASCVIVTLSEKLHNVPKLNSSQKKEARLLAEAAQALDKEREKEGVPASCLSTLGVFQALPDCACLHKVVSFYLWQWII